MLDVLLFETREWRDIQVLFEKKIMVLSDFVRLGLLYLYGGTWFDADSLIIRSFNFRNAVPCFRYLWARNQEWVQCGKFTKLPMFPFDPHLQFIDENGFSCANGFVGGFTQRHPFMRVQLLRIAIAFRSVVPDMLNNILGAHLITNVLQNTHLESQPNNSGANKSQLNSEIELLPGEEETVKSFSRHPLKLSLDEWPNIYPADRLLGDNADPKSLIRKHFNNTTKILEELSRKQAITVHIFNWHYNSPESMQTLLANDTYFYHLWKENCLYSCPS